MKFAVYSKLILVLLVLLTAAVAAFPCRCVPASLKTYYQRADAVVTAKVISVSTSTEGERLTTANLEILDAWKTDLPKQIEVITGSSCVYSFQTGEKHLLYLQKTPADKFSTMRCQGNLPLNKSQKSLNWLKKYGKKNRAELTSYFLPDFFEVQFRDFLFETADWFQTDDGEFL
ncbi:MAG TPA: hypothetical protein VGC97_04945 [Pyrinomonadaceae bacterium]|jgi:hypothetical protein